jgi:hypothetical protein
MIKIEAEAENKKYGSRGSRIMLWYPMKMNVITVFQRKCLTVEGRRWM